MVKHTKKLLVQSLKIVLSVGIIYWLIQSGKLNFSALKNMLAPIPMMVGLSLLLLNIVLGSERWRILIRSQQLSASPYSIFKLSLIGSFFNFAMPGGVGGDLIKAYYFTREHPGNKVTAVTSVLIDRVLGLFSMILMALIVMIYDLEHIWHTPTLKTLFWFIFILFICFAAGLALVFSPKHSVRKNLIKWISHLPLSEKFLKLYESMHLYGNDGFRIFLVIAISLLAQASSIAFLYYAGTLAGFADIPAKTYFLVAPLGFMATAIPVSPAGVGVGQAAFYFLFNIYTGTPTEVGPTCITAMQVGTFLVSLLGAVFYLRRKDRTDVSHLEESQI